MVTNSNLISYDNSFLSVTSSSPILEDPFPSMDKVQISIANVYNVKIQLYIIYCLKGFD